ncbi:MAG: hypothetical protein R3B99_04885 [Polyangiales bacterium]
MTERVGVVLVVSILMGLARPASAAPGLRAQSIQRGDFVLFGNTLGPGRTLGSPPRRPCRRRR